MKPAAIVIAALVAAGVAGPADSAKPQLPPRHDTIRVTPLSQQYSPSHAAISARIDARSVRRGRLGTRSRRTEPAVQITARTANRSTPGDAQVDLPNPFPSLRSDAPVLSNPAPLGPGSFWYPDGQGHVCMYAPNSVLPCFTVVVPPGAGAPGVPALSPAALASSVANRLPLQAGQIHASPTGPGLTGAASWFWLDPAPAATSLSVSLADEQVTVSAEPQGVEWRFGDGATDAGGAGVAYRPGPPPADAVTHVYGTRCLPGDQGRNPYVLSSCGANGYPVAAVVSWQVSYTARGPAASDGGLPARTTETSAVYPVSEARAFLVGGGR